MVETLVLDTVIFGGGAAGLWLLDDLSRAGRAVLLLEAGELGQGQTIASQGIIHGGLKYTLSGLLSSSAKAISEMPLIWRRCLAGEAAPNLSNTRMRASYCHLWRTASLRSRLAMIGARAGLRVAPVALEPRERPAALADCPGIVARLDEQVIEPSSFLEDLREQHRDRLLKIDVRNGLEFTCKEPGVIERIRLIDPDSGVPLDLKPSTVVLTAGGGNQDLRRLAGLEADIQQRRPLHMVMARGELPPLNGHCVDGSATRLTITSTRDLMDRQIWQIGGQIAERGVEMEEAELVRHAREEVESVLPGIDVSGASWAAYRVDRVEPATRSGSRPDDAFRELQGNIVTAWPTKLALAPRLSAMIGERLPAPSVREIPASAALEGWPRPIVALPPWETQAKWTAAD